MEQLENVYVIDKLENIGNYAKISDAFAKAVDVIKAGNFGALKPGKNEIDGDKAFVNNVVADLVETKDRKPELHWEYFDIHVPIDGDEVIGLDSTTVKSVDEVPGFDVKNDIGFLAQAVKYFTIHKGEFAITWPKTCAHAPACTCDVPKKSRKLIFKVKA